MRKRILVVEDSELNRDLLVQIFEDIYELEVAADGAEAVRLALETRPDLILMDIGLPEMSGLDAVRSIRASGAGTPIVAVTSRVMPGEREQVGEQRRRPDVDGHRAQAPGGATRASHKRPAARARECQGDPIAAA